MADFIPALSYVCNMMDTVVVIMAGGKGTRLWPLSTESKPKQFLDLLNRGSTLLQDTVRRAQFITSSENIYVVAPAQYEEIIKEQVPFVNFIAEPMPRNTAPTIAYALAYLLAHNKAPSTVMVVLPADHYIDDPEKWAKVMNIAVDYAFQSRELGTIGIVPTYPATGYGYIHIAQPIKPEKGLYKVKTFTEKPPLELARKFVDSGEYFWNSGMFIWRLDALQEAFVIYASEIWDICSEITDFSNHSKIKKFFMACPSISVDYAIMEKASNVFVVKADFQWSDLGSFKAIYDLLPHDQNGNAIIGNVIPFNTQNCLIVNASQDGVLAVSDEQEKAIIKTSDAVLTVNINAGENIRKVYKAITEQFPEYA